MSDKDFIPQTEDEFHTFQGKFVTAANANLSKYGLSQAKGQALAAKRTKYEDAVKTEEAALQAAHLATLAKQSAKHDLEGEIRSAVHIVNGQTDVNNDLRAELFLPPHAAHGSLPAPSTRPVVRAEMHGHSTVVLHIHDETTPDHGRKPHGISEAEIWYHLGAPAPADPSGYAKLGTSTKVRWVDVHAPADAGKDVAYVVRWVDGKGQPGPWSDAVTTKVPL